MDIKQKLKNKTFVITFATMAVAFIYQLLALIGVVPQVSESEVMNIVTMVVNMLALLGVLIDPNTEGIKDQPKE